MPRVFIPPLLRDVTGGVQEIEVVGTSVRHIIQELDARFPGLGGRLCVDGQLRPGLAVAVNGAVSSQGMLQKVPPTAEVHFLPAIGGG